MSDTARAAAPVVAERDAPVPPLVGVAWALLVVNALGSADVSTILPVPSAVFQVITMGSLGLSFVLALVLNPRIRLSPSAFLFMLTVLVVVTIASSMRLEAGVGSILRCARFAVFVATLWLLSTWWRGDLRFVRYHLMTLGAVLLSVLAGFLIAPGRAISASGRLSGVIYPIPATHVGQYAAIATGLVVILWLARRVDGRSCALLVVPWIGLMLLSYTRTALLGLAVALVVVLLGFAVRESRARLTLVLGAGVVTAVALAFGSAIAVWLRRGQPDEQIANLTGREAVWSQLFELQRDLLTELIGTGLSDKGFNGLAIDGSWPAVYHEQGLLGVACVIGMLGVLIVAAVLRRPSTARTCAMFLILYCLIATYTEVSLSDASPYLLHLAVAASLLVPSPAPRPT